MNIERLVAMANDIAAFFAAEPDANSASTKVADHLRRFWAPRMREQLLAYVRTGGDGLAPLARSAVERLDNQPPR